jgi:hypothetical protein
MSRSYRLTVRLTEAEIRSVRKFANVKHVLPAVAVRWLLSTGLAAENRAPPQGGPMTAAVLSFNPSLRSGLAALRAAWSLLEKRE